MPRDSLHPTTAPRRIAGVDGLRAVAVLLVVLYHLLPGALPGGMVGVDAFYVISGFLITTLLLDERRRTGRIDLLRFWGRRLRRIVPALVVAMLVVVSLAACLGGDVLLGVRRQVLGAAGLVYNWVEIAAGSSYFDQSQPLLLTNVWSLAVEEQFYLLWPLILLVLLMRSRTRQGTRRAALVALALAIGSLVWGLLLLHGGQGASRVYMGTDTHAFGLMLGAALALWHGHALDGAPAYPLPARLRLGRGALGWAGLAALIVCARSAQDATAGASATATTLWLAAASVATVLVLQALTGEVIAPAGPARLLPALLETRGMTWLGTRSYGIYLWHWPLWVLAFYALPATTDPRLVALGVGALTIVAAELSYGFIETPIRRAGLVSWLRSARTMRPRQIVALSGSVTVVVLLMALAFSAQPRVSTAQAAIEAGARQLASVEASASAASSAASSAKAPATSGASATTGAAQTPAASAAPGASVKVDGADVEVVGDSVVLASVPALEESLPGVAVDAEVSRSVYAALPTIQSLDAKYGKRRYVVVALATNGSIAEDQLEAILSYLGPDRRLVLVTGYGPARTTWIPGANAAISAFASAHSGQVVVADWAAAIQGKVALLAEDQVHPGPEAARIYAATVDAALGSLPA